MEHLESVAQEMSEFVAVTDADLRLRFVNEAGRAMAGLGPGEGVDAVSLPDLFALPARDTLGHEATAKALRDGVFRSHGVMVRRDGRLVDVQVSLRPIPMGEGEPPRFGVVLREVEHLRVQRRLEWLLAASRVVLYACRTDGDYGATYISENVRRTFGYEPRQFIEDSRFWVDRVHPEDVQRILDGLPALFEHGHHSHDYRFLHADGSWRWVHDDLVLSRNEDGSPMEMLGTWQDVSERKEVELLVRRQADALMEVSTPIIPITDDVLVMPLVGAIEPARAAQVLESLLSGISRSGAGVAILDITGVAVVDAQVADALLGAARAARLLGASVILTGIRSDVARTLVQMGADLGDVVTCSTLQAGVLRAMHMGAGASLRSGRGRR